MVPWIKALRAQTIEIAGGRYQPDPAAFRGAPADVLTLSEDLNGLARTMAERDRAHQALIHEVHHRVKNNLQIVTSLLNMQASKMRDPVARQALGQTRARMGALALIHRMLYEQTDDGSAGQINIARLMTELCAQLRLMYRDRNDVEFICDASAVAIPLDSAVPLTLLSVEAVTNAYNHAFPEGRSGTVTLHFGLTKGYAILRVSDDGAGFDAGGAFTSMGRQLMEAFAHQLGGKLRIERDKPSGTIVTLRYPAGL